MPRIIRQAVTTCKDRRRAQIIVGGIYLTITLVNTIALAFRRHKLRELPVGTGRKSSRVPHPPLWRFRAPLWHLGPFLGSFCHVMAPGWLV